MHYTAPLFKIILSMITTTSWVEWINKFENNYEINSLVLSLKEKGESWDLNDHPLVQISDLVSNVLESKKLLIFSQTNNFFIKIITHNGL